MSSDLLKGEVIFEIYAGTYEEFLLGFHLVSAEEGFKLEQIVADHSHKASLRSVSARGSLLASGGVDEIIHLYNIEEKKETGTLNQHTGTVTCLAFTSDEKHLISCSEDGTIAIFQVGSWIMEMLFPKAHKGAPVNWIGVHPSNKMAFTVGNDGHVRTWNLIEGKHAFASNMSKKSKRLEFITWSIKGDTYAFPYDCKVEVYSTDKAKLLSALTTSSKVTALTYLEENIICIGNANGSIEAFSADIGERLWEHKIRDSRVKCMATHTDKLVTACSEGIISVFSWTIEGVHPLASVDTECRITCLTMSCKCHRWETKKKKRKIKKEVKKEAASKIKLNGTSAKKICTKGSWEVTEVTSV